MSVLATTEKACELLRQYNRLRIRRERHRREQRSLSPRQAAEFERIHKQYRRMLEEGTLVEIGDELLRRWEQRRSAAGVSLLEKRAMLPCLPGVVHQLAILQAARDHKLATEEQRNLLDEKITQIMDETLVPLATEIAAARSLELMGVEAAGRALLEMRVQQLLNS